MEPVQWPPLCPLQAFDPYSEHWLKHIRYQHRLHRPSRLDATALQHDDVIAVLRRQVHVMDGHESGHAYAADELKDFELVADVEVVGGLIEDQDTRLLHESAGDQRALLLSPGQCAERPSASSAMST